MVASIDFFERGNVNIVFSRRRGGCSASPYDSLNIGTHVGDDIGNVIRNRELLQNQIAQKVEISKHSNWLFLNQTHKNNIVTMTRNYVVDNDNPPQGDASITVLKDQPLVCMTADCGPLVIFSSKTIGVIHASWKTVAAGIVESCFEELRATDPDGKFSAMLGPCIHAKSYEFEDKLLRELEAMLGSHVRSETQDGKPAFDLVSAIEHKLKVENVDMENLDVDTFTSENHYSYRRDGITGRQAVVAWLK